MELHDILLASARAEGFPLAGALDIDSGMAALAAHVEYYDRWLARGSAGAMEYLVRGRDRRADPKLVFPEARSILCVAIPYPRRAAGAASPAEGPRYARYLQGGDYHKSVAERLERTIARASVDWLAQGGRPFTSKVCVDTSAVLERSWAALAGLGWIGKNTMLIHPKLGSHLFLAEALISEPVGRGPAPIADLCGHCTRCLEACPPQALKKSEPGVLDARKCISYWTLEKRGELALGAEDRAAASNWVAGCDLCQEACPFNFKPAREPQPEPLPAGDAAALVDWEGLLRESEGGYRARVADSALKRVKPGQFSRNLAIALGNSISLIPDSSRARLLTLVINRAEADPAAATEWARCRELLEESLQSPKRKP